MKLQNVLTQSLLCAALTGLPLFSSFAYPSQAAKKPQAIQPSKAAEGGASGGGGNAHTAQALTAQEIRIKLERGDDIRAVAQSLLYRLDGRDLVGGDSTKDTPLLDSATKKLKAYGIQKAINRVSNLYFYFSKKCLDPITKEDSDAYADVQREFICFNVERLSKKNITQLDYTNILGSLLVHEISHFFGATENEALIVQAFAQRYSLSIYALSEAKQKVTRTLRELNLMLNANIATMSQIRVCQHWALISSKSTQLAEELFYQPAELGTFLMPAKTAESVTVLDGLINYTKDAYCLNGNERIDSESKADINKMFGNKKALQMYGVNFNRVNFGDKIATIVNAKEAQRQIDAFLKLVKQSLVQGECTVVSDNGIDVYGVQCSSHSSF